MTTNKRHTPLNQRLEKALQLRHAGRRREALRHLSELSREYPTAGLIWFHLAETFDMLGRERQAIPRYHRALRLSPNLPHRYELLLYLSSSYRKTARPLAAARYLAQAEAMKRNSPLQHRLRALIDRDLRQLKPRRG